MIFTFQISPDEIILAEHHYGEVDPNMVIKKANIRNDTTSNVGLEELKEICKYGEWNREERIALWICIQRISGKFLEEIQPKLYQLKSDTIELYYGFEYSYHRSVHFYFLHTPSLRKAQIALKPWECEKSDFKTVKKEAFTEFRKAVEPTIKQQLHLSDFEEISIRGFNPTGFSQKDYQKVWNAIKSDELKGHIYSK